jgi:hypothetical protein
MLLNAPLHSRTWHDASDIALLGETRLVVAGGTELPFLNPALMTISRALDVVLVLGFLLRQLPSDPAVPGGHPDVLTTGRKQHWLANRKFVAQETLLQSKLALNQASLLEPLGRRRLSSAS